MLSLYIFFDFRLKQFQLQAFTYQNKKHNPLFLSYQTSSIKSEFNWIFNNSDNIYIFVKNFLLLGENGLD